MKLLYSIAISLVLLLSQSCSEDDTLASVINDKELADYLSGQWTHTMKGKGYVSFEIILTFSHTNNVLKRDWITNKYKTSKNFNHLSVESKITGKEKADVIEITAVSGFKSYIRIEKINAKKMRIYERFRTRLIELPGKEYTKIHNG